MKTERVEIQLSTGEIHEHLNVIEWSLLSDLGFYQFILAEQTKKRSRLYSLSEIAWVDLPVMEEDV